MDNLNNQTPAPSPAGDVREQLDALRHLITSTLVLVLIISGTLNIYLLRQWRSASRDLGGIRPQAVQIITEYDKVSGPLMNDFIKKITEYGRTHPDFAPILAKYGIKPGAPTNLPATTPAAPAAKK